VVLASEDIGLADPSALTTAVAVADAVAFIGMPEGRIVLAQAVIALACAPKSNAVIVAIDEAIADVRAGRLGNVPAPLRDSHYARAGTLGHGVGYIYPHNTPEGIAAQQYAPDPVLDRQYYRPTRRGTEERYAERLERLRRALGRESGEPSRGEDGR
jgi:putative ATPase